MRRCSKTDFSLPFQSFTEKHSLTNIHGKDEFITEGTEL